MVPQRRIAETPNGNKPKVTLTERKKLTYVHFRAILDDIISVKNKQLFFKNPMSVVMLL